MKFYYNILSALLAVAMLSAAASCSKQETPSLSEEPSAAQTVTLTASMELPDSGTKTSLNLADNKVLWSTGDKISVFFSDNTANNEFTLSSVAGTETGSFTGTAPDPVPSTFYAVYPYNSGTTISGSTVTLNFPYEQNYNSAGGFNINTNPAVAYTTSGGNLEFKNLCGVLKLSLTGTATIDYIDLTGVDNLSGTATVSMNYGSEGPTVTMTGTNSFDKSLGLYIDPPVTLDPVTPKDFYIVVPPTDKGFRVTVYEELSFTDALTKTSSTSINRNKIRPMPPITYVADTPIDLSAAGTANCYIPSTGAGIYRFKANVMGNGTAGIISGGNFPTSDAAISPVSASLLWEDVPGLISAVELVTEGSEKYVSFIASKSILKGNAVIAVYEGPSATGPVLWSWHIWCTDQPTDQAYKNAADKTFTLLDRNLGATSNSSAGGESSYGLHYQWGRKDPFQRTPINLAAENKTDAATNGNINYSIAHPNVFITASSDWLSAKNDYLWGNPQGYNTTYTASKSIYDPCPPGYMVAPRDTWTNFDKGSKQPNKEGDWSNGFNFFLQGSTLGTPTTWYPAVGCRNFGDGLLADSDIAYYWSSSPFSSGDWTANLYFHSSRVNTWAYENRAYGFSVRCLLVGGK